MILKSPRLNGPTISFCCLDPISEKNAPNWKHLYLRFHPSFETWLHCLQTCSFHLPLPTKKNTGPGPPRILTPAPKRTPSALFRLHPHQKICYRDHLSMVGIPAPTEPKIVERHHRFCWSVTKMQKNNLDINGFFSWLGFFGEKSSFVHGKQMFPRKIESEFTCAANRASSLRKFHCDQGTRHSAQWCSSFWCEGNCNLICLHSRNILTVPKRNGSKLLDSLGAESFWEPMGGPSAKL